MASNKGKKKKGGKAASSNTQKINKYTYFCSDRIKRLPQSDYYITLASMLDDTSQVLCTRAHINGNISFALFSIIITTGQIENCYIDFNQEKDNLEKLIADFNLDPVDDRQAIELMIYQAIEATESKSSSKPEDLRFAQNILKEDYEALKTANINLLFPFQHPLWEEQWEEKDSTQQEESPIPHIYNDLPTYDPGMVKGWDCQKWKDFLLKITNLKDRGILEPEFFSPLLFIFERHTLVVNDYVSEEFMEQIDRLMTLSTPLDNSGLDPWFKDYKPSAAEAILEHSLLIECHLAKTDKARIAISRKMEQFMKTYPENPMIPLELFNLYGKLKYKTKSYPLACEYYKQYPDCATPIAYYFTQLTQESKPNLIAQLLSNGILLEDQVKKEQKFALDTYSIYYRNLARYLFDEDWYHEYWKLTHYFLNLPQIKENHYELNRWRMLHIFAIDRNYRWISLINNDLESFDKDIIAVLAKASQSLM